MSRFPFARHLTKALSALSRLHIVTFSSRSTGYGADGRESKTLAPTDELIVNEKFRSNLRLALTGGYVVHRS